MIFKDQIATIIEPEISEFGLSKNLEESNMVEFVSPVITISFVHDERECSNCYFIKHNDFDLMIENLHVERYLGIKIKPIFTDKTQIEKSKSWIEFVAGYLINEHCDLLLGDKELYKKLYIYLAQQSEAYTNKLKGE